MTSALIGAEAPSEQLLTAAFTGDVELAAALLDTQPQPASNNGCFAPIHAATQNGHTQASAVCHGPPRPHTVSLPHCLALVALTLSRSISYTLSHAEAVSWYLPLSQIVELILQRMPMEMLRPYSTTLRDVHTSLQHTLPPPPVVASLSVCPRVLGDGSGNSGTDPTVISREAAGGVWQRPLEVCD